MTMATNVIPDQALEEVRGLYERGLYLQAYRLTEQFGPLKAWSGAVERVIALKRRYALGPSAPAAEEPEPAGDPSGLVLSLDQAVAQGIDPISAPPAEPEGPPYEEHQELARRLSQ